MRLAVDASAIVAILVGEQEALSFQDLLAGADEAWATSFNLTEAGIVLVLRDGRLNLEQYEAWLDAHRIKAFANLDHVAALRAYLTYGKGVHRAGLNMGDCFAYALAKQLNAPLLFKGDDFRWTDVIPAVQPT